MDYEVGEPVLSGERPSASSSTQSHGEMQSQIAVRPDRTMVQENAMSADVAGYTSINGTSRVVEISDSS